ncbi:MAG TPA: NAD(P)/FAD-dependent oxidoreductase [Methanocella sp.]|uniref:phytoene desaturase family protein n=1 Tax=Methanocella sp. TaxID=2052833 RepID=UPI002BF8E0B6|nr:NAD(P)/FAD-dependent oxidoreductase [Methanocella sp.]HTY90144.1 NAD(P)/FAD-dependent oxidoreductase [Methanocella sp.]
MRVSIIGAGLGGLLAGAALSKEHDVDVYERLDIYGGRFTNLPYKGFQLTTGALHMIPQGPTGPLAELLKQVGAGVNIVRTDPMGCFMTKDNAQISFFNFRELLSSRAQARIPALMAKMLIPKKGTVSDMVWGDPEWLALSDSCCGWALSTLSVDTPAAEASGIIRHVIGGGPGKYNTPGVPMGGCGAVVDALAGVVEKNGGKIHLGSKVDSVLVEDGKAKGVAVDGEKRGADIVISDIGHRLTAGMYDARYLNPKYAGVLQKLRPSEGVKICLAAEEPLVGHPGVVFTPYTQRVNGMNEVTHIDPSLAPEGMHLTMTHQALRSGDVENEIKLGLQDIRNMFQGKKYSVLLVQTYRRDWPVNRIASGFDPGNLTPVKGLYVVGDGAKGRGYIEVEGVAAGVKNLLDALKARS